MHQRLAPEASEDRFRKFSAELLAAEEVGFRGGFFYSPDALRKILERFCDIIAEKLNVQSCTVQLKLYDSLNSPVLQRLLDNNGELPDSSKIKELNGCSADLQTLWENFSHKCKKRYEEVVKKKRYDVAMSKDNQASDKQIKFREILLKNSIIFPYAFYPKGALWLAASNKKGPWARCAPWLISEINRGIMTQIIQDKAARVRDRMSLRQTRSHRKLGLMDPHIWTNQPWPTDSDDQSSPLYFFNYYGVPILIHQGGDVIGILRVENKGLGAVKKETLEEPKAVVHRVLSDALQIPLDTTDVAKFAETLRTRFLGYETEILNSGNEFEPQDISLLSLVYLAHDLVDDAKRDSDNNVGDLCTLPFPHSKDTETSTVTPTGGEDSRVDQRPPIQITFDNSEEEQAFVYWLSGTRKLSGTEKLSETKKEDDQCRFQTVQKFYATLNTEFSAPLSENINSRIERALQNAIKEAAKFGADWIEPRITFKPVEPRSLLHTIQLDVPGKQRFLFHVQVTPMRAELEVAKLVNYWELSEESAKQFCNVNSDDFTHRSDDWEFHLPTDRLAARIDALTFAFPIPKFSISDAWWLSWAALEIGKLIERQISYRGTNISPTVPLTAMDFFRVPISDLSFVDALRGQYKAAETVKGMLEYHIPNHCRDLDLELTLEHNCRVKNFRSYLERIGQEHRAYYDALIGTWLYILCLRLGARTERVLNKAINKHKQKCIEEHLRDGLEDYFSNLNQCVGLYKQAGALAANLNRFYRALKTLCESDSVLFTRKDIRWLRNSGPNVFGDLKFGAPNVDLAQAEKARALILRNLRLSPQAADRTSTDLDEQMDDKEIIEYVLRRYDPFVTHGISLYILLTNIIENKEEGKGYKEFYDKCRRLTKHLRDKFEESYQVHEQWRDVPKSPTKSLIDELGLLRAKISELSTTDFSSVLYTAVMDMPERKETPSASEAYLSVKGIYKRARTLINIAGNQVCPPLLNWETSRFDYVGARINCLFKNQVFAIYEHLWNRGDPFSHWTSEIPEEAPKDTCARESRQAEAAKQPRPIGQCGNKEERPQRWLSIQTKIHKGEDGYNAWQFSALMDPIEVFERDPASRLYSVNALRNYLVLAVDEWDPGFATAYRKLAIDRLKWQEDYCGWFRRGYITHVLRKDSTSTESQRPEDVYFPEYLLRTPLDILIRLLETDLVSKEDYQTILDCLREFIDMSSPRDDLDSPGDDARSLWAVAEKIYVKARELADEEYSERKMPDRQSTEVLSDLELKELENALHGQLPILDQEKSLFEDPAKWPNRSAFQKKTLRDRLDDMGQVLKSNTNVTEIWRKGLRHVLIDLQSSQKQYLFNIGDTRSSQNIRDRILCYVLLFDPKLGGEVDPDIKEWSAYDLFYYLTSLVPAEFQVRTALADTMAEQYHGVYKSNVNPAHSVAVQRRRLQEMGRKLDDLDRETEAIYDVYIVNSMRQS
jgi:hypothetical protein